MTELRLKTVISIIKSLFENKSELRGSQMSRKGVPSASKSKQVPRIFRNRRAPSFARVWTHVDVGIGSITSEQNDTNSLTSSPDERKKRIDDKKGKVKARNNEEAIGYTEKVWCLDYSSIHNGVFSDGGADLIEKTTDVETVADIEKWLKTRTESVSSMDLDVIKSEVEEGVERYLNNELPHSFLGKDPDALSIDIDLSDKKLNLSYEHSILQEFQTEKLLEVCEKDDEFILPEFRLDQLDPLSLSPDDMMVAGEILPSTSGPTALNTPNEHLTDTSIQSEEGAQLVGEGDETENHTSADDSVEMADLPIDFENIDVMQETSGANNIVSSSKSTSNSFTDVFNNDNVIENTTGIINIANSGNIIMEQLKSKARIKLEPRIIKKRRRISEKFDKKIESKEGVMAVVAISTDKISNMTQIVINTGTEEQIYQGKTSELIEATGNFPKLPRIDTSPGWTGTSECNSEMNPSNQHEMIISNALAELGVTDDNLQPISITEHGKLWLCPREDCNRQFSRLYALKGHLLAHYGVRPFKCDYEGCAWAFYSEFKLKRHKETHSKRKDYVCQVEGCNRRFTTIYNLWSHEKLHSRPNRITCQNASVPVLSQPCETSLNNGSENQSLKVITHQDEIKTLYHCPVETCTRSYSTKATLRAHMSKIHGTPIGDCDKSLKSRATDITTTNTDYILYATPSSTSEPTEQMIMVTPCDAVIVSASSEMNSLPETQPPLLGTVLRNDSIHENATNEQLLQSNLRKDHGSARTSLTFSDVWKLKTNGASMNSVAGASDVILGASDMEEELLFTEELPSMYYQDDVGGTEYQVLLLDSGPSESAVNLRGLE
ncbi:zinc finger and BTB domain-containing protein 17-like isoform X2 [Vespula maculifrons]|uniref:Zinc finger and BTB domain-containing protein 17-like isoform X2 n=1 Tax=Vespula maculifrons TaxID=7453 RepID=A0ABD2CIW3_VESMC